MSVQAIRENRDPSRGEVERGEGEGRRHVKERVCGKFRVSGTEGRKEGTGRAMVANSR